MSSSLSSSSSSSSSSSVNSSSSSTSLLSLLSRLPYKVVICWLVLLFFGYYFSLPSTLSTEEKLLHPQGPIAYHTQAALLHRRTKDYFPQAVVFVIMGNLAKESLVEDALLAVRLLGRWEEKIIILTDRPGCFQDAQANSMSWTIIPVAPRSSLIEIKAMKAEIFQYLPNDIHRVLYMDVDILVTRNLGFFLQDLSHLLYFQFPAMQPIGNGESGNSGSLSIGKNESSSSLTNGQGDHLFSMAAFLDAKGHYVGFCSGCEKWHSGVIYMVRDYGKQCLAAWASVLRSGRFGTDQESLDYVENAGNCSRMVTIPSRHLLFAKDYIGMLFTSGQTFIHLTSANRLDTQDFFYKDYVIPRIRNSLHPPLKPYNPNPSTKTC